MVALGHVGAHTRSNVSCYCFKFRGCHGKLHVFPLLRTALLYSLPRSLHAPFIPLCFFLRVTQREISRPTIYPMRQDDFRTRCYTHKWEQNKIHLSTRTLAHNTNVLSLPRCRLACSDAWHAKKYPNTFREQNTRLESWDLTSMSLMIFLLCVRLREVLTAMVELLWIKII